MFFMASLYISVFQKRSLEKRPLNIPKIIFFVELFSLIQLKHAYYFPSPKTITKYGNLIPTA